MKIGIRKSEVLLYLFGLLVCVAGVVIYIYMIYYAIHYEEGSILYVAVSFSVLMLMANVCLISGTVSNICELVSTIILDEEGVLNKTSFYEESLKWEEVRDYDTINGIGGLRYERYIYLSGKKISHDDLYTKWGNLKCDSEMFWYPAMIKKKRNQKKEDIFIVFPYKKDRWDYVRDMMVKRKEYLERYLDELQKDCE